ncbi:MAG: DUF6529 family protein [Dehalococcoidia bacterium]
MSERAVGLRNLGLLAALAGAALLLWFRAVAGQPPGFRTVLDLKISVATAVFLLAVVQALMASVFYGWLKTPWPSAEAAAFVHRWNGRVVLPAATLVMIYCLKDIGPQADPVRVAVHSTLGGAVIVVAFAKLFVLRFVPRLSLLVPPLGFTLAGLFTAMWLTSAFYVLTTRSSGYAAADIGAAVAIVSDPAVIGRYDPVEVRVRVDQAVVWTNNSDAPHTVTRVGGGFDSSIIDRGGVFRWPAKSPGVFEYRCTLHPQMPVAKIIVEDK